MDRVFITLVTPTIGRAALRRCVRSAQEQIVQIHRHIVVGDGPQPEWVRALAWTSGFVYEELPERKGFFGTFARNRALEMIESEYPTEYVAFVDDDNELLMNYTYNVQETARANGNPDLLLQQILYTGKFNTKYELMPKDSDAAFPEKGSWDGLNGVYRAGAIRGLRWGTEYTHDHEFARAAQERSGAYWRPIDGVNAIHHCSWDTYAEAKRMDVEAASETV